jgi:hypothetical protein
MASRRATAITRTALAAAGLALGVTLAHDVWVNSEVMNLRAMGCEAKDGLTRLSARGCAAKLDRWMTTADAARVCEVSLACGVGRYEVTARDGLYVARWRSDLFQRGPEVWCLLPPGPPIHCRNMLNAEPGPWLLDASRWRDEQAPECARAVSIVEGR